MKRRTFAFPALLILILGVCGVLFFFQPGTEADEGKSAGSKETAQAQDGQKSPEGLKEPEKLPVVLTQKAQQKSLSRTLELTGSVTASKIARLASPGEGPVQDCAVREGDRVKQGRRVLVIGRNKAAQALLSAAQEALSEQAQELQRVKQLVENGAIPGVQLDAARTKYENAKAQVAKARESAEDFSIVVPWDGVVSKVSVADGDYVAPRTPLVEIFDPRSLVVQLAVPEAQSTRVREHMPVQVHLDAYPGQNFKGEIDRVYPQLDTRMRTRTVEVKLSDSVELIPGMFARVQLFLETVADAVVVPAEAVKMTPKGAQVAFVVESGKALQRKVETGIETEEGIQITKGIQPGELVIVSGHEKLKDGATVQVQGEKKR